MFIAGPNDPAVTGIAGTLTKFYTASSSSTTQLSLLTRDDIIDYDNTLVNPSINTIRGSPQIFSEAGVGMETGDGNFYVMKWNIAYSMWLFVSDDLDPGNYKGNDNLIRPAPTASGRRRLLGAADGAFTANGVGFVGVDSGNQYSLANSNAMHVMQSSNQAVPAGNWNTAVKPGDVEYDNRMPKDYTISSVCFDTSAFRDADPGEVDIFLLSDTTGSMSSAIESVRDKANNIVSAISSVAVDVRYGVGEYRDEDWSLPNDDFFRLGLSMGRYSQTQIWNVLDGWVQNVGGGKNYGGQGYALYQVATSNSIGWRSGSAKFVVWFGDVVPRDPTGGITISQAISALKAKGIVVIAIDASDGTYLNSDGTAARVTSGTGGQYIDTINSDVGTIIASRLPTFVSRQIAIQPIAGTCNRGNIKLSFTSYAFQRVTPGTNVCFTPKLTFQDGVCTTSTVRCTMTLSDLSSSDLRKDAPLDLRVSRC
ncbi:hypothetical protein HXX76_011815 [Chlamydomonas incerta]|uniref:VWFA domain-containing protein n=1 Tax=Chlamydomonas incerta TaxID=51695 RepID=A0A835SX46_CHLIN|nr:hypothetical protein HXX76_011815 [Chlamydomonas incerta]|eukprot:KAG2428135.1 hypothetical protein HXX76_011815 [Chlamydomonas incerta]